EIAAGDVNRFSAGSSRFRLEQQLCERYVFVGGLAAYRGSSWTPRTVLPGHPDRSELDNLNGQLDIGTCANLVSAAGTVGTAAKLLLRPLRRVAQHALARLAHRQRASCVPGRGGRDGAVSLLLHQTTREPVANRLALLYFSNVLQDLVQR